MKGGSERDVPKHEATAGSARGGASDRFPTQRRDNSRGVSHVIGIILMLAVTVLLVSVMGAMALGFELPGEQAPTVASESGFEPSPDYGSDHALVLTHDGGDNVDTDDVYVHINTEGQSTRKELPATGDLADGEWSAGEQLSFEVETDDICAGGDEASIRLVHENDEDETTTITEQTVPLQASEFEIQGGAVVPEHDYRAEVEIVETEYTDGNAIEVQPIVGGDVKSSAFSPITQHTNVEPSQSPAVFSGINGGTPIRVRAKSSNTQLSTTWVNSNNAGVGSQVWVRRDGESVPTNAGGGNQQDLEDTVSEYANNGQITLDDNQALYMYELFTDDPNNQYYEYQDAIVLVTFTSEEDHPDLVEQSGEPELVCPS